MDGSPCSDRDHNSESTMADPSATRQEDTKNTKNSSRIDSRIDRVWLYLSRSPAGAPTACVGYEVGVGTGTRLGLTDYEQPLRPPHHPPPTTFPGQLHPKPYASQ
eukprot:372083-Rhodomonas_salina.1